MAENTNRDAVKDEDKVKDIGPVKPAPTQEEYDELVKQYILLNGKFKRLAELYNTVVDKFISTEGK